METSRTMDAIFQGVHTRYDSLLGLTRITTEETVKIARRLGIPNDEIEKWMEVKRKLYLEGEPKCCKAGSNRFSSNRSSGTIRN